MAEIRLEQFIGSHQEEIIARCRAKSKTTEPPQSSRAPGRGIPLFLDQLVAELGTGPTRSVEMKASAGQHGRDLFADGYSIGELVHDYGGVCQSVTDMAVETATTISAKDFRTLNRCLDDAIAGAVAEYAQRERASGDSEAIRLRDLVYIISTAFDVLRDGRVGVSGATGDLVHRSLGSLRALVDHLPK